MKDVSALFAVVLTACVPQVQHDARSHRLSDFDPCGALEMLQRGHGLSDDDPQDLAMRCAAQQTATADAAYTRQANAAAENLAAMSTALAAQEVAQAIAMAEHITTQLDREQHAPEYAARDLVARLREHAQTPERLRLALLPIICGARVAKDVCAEMENRFEATLTDTSDAVLIEHAHVRAVLREQSWQQSDDVDAETAVAVGRLIGASHLVTLAITATPDDAQRYALSVRSVAVETARVATVHLRYHR